MAFRQAPVAALPHPLEASRFSAAGLLRHLPPGRAQDLGSHRHLFLEQLAVGGHGGVGHKAALHDLSIEGIVDGDQAHAQVMGHIGAHRLKGLSSGPALGGEIRRLVKAVGALQPQVPQAAQVAYRPARHQRQCQERGVGGDDQFPV